LRVYQQKFEYISKKIDISVKKQYIRKTTGTVCLEKKLSFYEASFFMHKDIQHLV